MLFSWPTLKWVGYKAPMPCCQTVCPKVLGSHVLCASQWRPGCWRSFACVQGGVQDYNTLGVDQDDLDCFAFLVRMIAS